MEENNSVYIVCEDEENFESFDSMFGVFSTLKMAQVYSLCKLIDDYNWDFNHDSKIMKDFDLLNIIGVNNVFELWEKINKEGCIDIDLPLEYFDNDELEDLGDDEIPNISIVICDDGVTIEGYTSYVNINWYGSHTILKKFVDAELVVNMLAGNKNGCSDDKLLLNFD